MITYEVQVSGIYRINSEEELSQDQIEEMTNSNLGSILDCIDIGDVEER